MIQAFAKRRESDKPRKSIKIDNSSNIVSGVFFKMSKRKQFSKTIRREVLDKTSGRCAYCGCPLPINEMQIDHVIPLYNGGTNDIDNLLPSCRSCNHYKDTFSLEMFRDNIESIPQVLNDSSASYRIAKRYGIIHEDRKKRVEFYFEKIKRRKG